MGQLEGGLGVFSKPKEVGFVGRKGRRKVKILVLEYEESGGVGGVRCGVEENVIGGFA